MTVADRVESGTMASVETGRGAGDVPEAAEALAEHSRNLEMKVNSFLVSLIKG